MAEGGSVSGGMKDSSRPPLTRGRSLTDVLRGLVINQSQQNSTGASAGIRGIAEESGPESQQSGGLGRMIESQGLTAGVGASDMSGGAPTPGGGDQGGGSSWSFFWRSSAQKVIEMNRNNPEQSSSGEDMGGEQKSKILGAYMNSNVLQGDKPPIRTLLGAVTAMQQMEAAKATGLEPAGVATVAGPGGKKGLLNLPDKMNVRKKEMNVLSPSSF